MFLPTRFVFTLSLLLVLVLCCASAAQADFTQTDLVSNVPGLAPVTDSNLKNSWGMAFSPTSPMWVSNAASSTSTLYNALSPSIKQSLVVNVPLPTGIVFNSTASDFMIPAPSGTVQATFLFDTLGGTIQGWNPGSNGGLNNAELAKTVPGAAFTGLALANSGGANYLYAADAVLPGGIFVFDSNFNNVTGTTFAGKFVDPTPIAGYTPFDIQNLNGNLFVTYTPGLMAGGYVDEFDAAGDFLARIATNGPLNAPWGLTIAPSGFGTFGGDLLVGNLLDSKINAFSLTTLGQLDGSITVNTGFTSPEGLWALHFGNGVTGDPNALYFTAGVNNQQDGLFGEITFRSTVPEPATLALLGIGLVGLGFSRRERKQ